VGAHGIWNFRAGALWRAGILLLGLHRSLEGPAAANGRSRPRKNVEVYSLVLAPVIRRRLKVLQLPPLEVVAATSQKVQIIPTT
jgi:hypothetical protein